MKKIGYKLPVAILGTGKIGLDLFCKALKSSTIFCSHIITRSDNSDGIKMARALGAKVFSKGLEAFNKEDINFKVLFDATSAQSHHDNFRFAQYNDLKIINLTPATLGVNCVPFLNKNIILNADNINMITCGGQATIPIAYAVTKAVDGIRYIETVSSISSASAGIATRDNIDEYIEKTESALIEFTGCQAVKAILIINPADPPISMQTTIYFITDNDIDIEKIKYEIALVVKEIQLYIPGYQIILGPEFIDRKLVVMIRIEGSGDYLPKFSGNLDIITCAAIKVAEEFSLGCKKHG